VTYVIEFEKFTRETSSGVKCSILNSESLSVCLFFCYQLRPREKEAFNYAEKLKEKYGHHPEVRRIARHRHVPKAIHSAQKELRTIRTSHKKKFVYFTPHFYHVVHYRAQLRRGK